MNANRLIAAGIAFIALIYVLSSSIFVVDQRKFAVVFSFGQIVRVIEQPGLQVKYPSPFESVRFFDRRILTIDNPEAERFITAEKKNLLVDSYVKWRIVDPRKFFISFKGDERLAQDRLTQLVRSALNEEFTKRTVRELISDQREQVMQGIRKKVADDASDIGVEIVDVRLKRVDLLAEISDSVYRRMEAERKRAWPTSCAQPVRLSPTKFVRMPNVSAIRFWPKPTVMPKRSKGQGMPRRPTFMLRRLGATPSLLSFISV